MQELCFAAFNGNLREMIAALDKGYDINGVDHRVILADLTSFKNLLFSLQNGQNPRSPSYLIQ